MAEKKAAMPYDWSLDQVSQLIDLFEERDYLYVTTNKDYHNRDKRRKGLKEISDHLGIPVKDVEKKLKGLRSQYLREKRNVNKRQPTGTGTDDVYESKWVLFKRLEFLNIHTSSRSSHSNLKVENDSDAMMQESDGEGSSDDNRSELSTEIDTTNCNESSSSLDQQSANDRPIRSTKRPLKGGGKSKPTKHLKQNQEDVLLMKAIECIEKTKSVNDNRNQKNDPDDVFGEYIATELKSIKDIHQKRAIKFRIQSLLFSSLTPNSSAPIEPIPAAMYSYPSFQQLQNAWLPSQYPPRESRSSTPTSEVNYHQTYPDHFPPFSPPSSSQSSSST